MEIVGCLIPPNSSIVGERKELKPLNGLTNSDKQTVEFEKKKVNSLGQIRDLLMRAAEAAKVTNPDELKKIEAVANKVVELDGAEAVFKSRVLLQDKGLMEDRTHLASDLEYNPPPEVAPELWKNRKVDTKEKPVQFIQRVYEPWLDKGFTTADLRNLDSALYRAYYNQQKENSGTRVPNFHIPTKGEQAGTWMERVGRGASISELRGTLGKEGAELLRNSKVWKERHISR